MLYGIFCWLDDFIFIRKVFTDILLLFDQRSSLSLAPPSLTRLKSATFRRYGSYKSLIILFKERWFISWGLTVLCIVSILFILPALVLGYMVWLRFFCLRKFSTLEQQFLQASNSSQAVRAVFNVESTDSFNMVLDMIFEHSQNDETRGSYGNR